MNQRLSRTPSLVIINLLFIGCNSSSDMILLKPSCIDTRRLGQTRFVHVDFSNNHLSNSASLIHGRGASCTQLSLENVEFAGNHCSGEGCVLLSSNATLQDVRVLKNRKGRVSSECSIFSTKAKSEILIENMSALRNEIRVFHVLRTSLRIRRSHFEGNMKKQSARRSFRKTNGGVIFARSSVFSIRDSTYEGNFAASGGALFARLSKLQIKNCMFHRNNASIAHGGAIYLRGGSSSRIISTNFTENTANFGGAFFFASVNVSLRDSQFIRNVASQAGGGIIQRTLSFEIEGVLFGGNRAILRWAGVLQFSASSMCQITNSTFQNNRAVGIGGVMTVTSRSQLKLNAVVFVNNTAGKDGGAISAHSFAHLDILKSDFSSASFYLNFSRLNMRSLGNRGILGGALFGNYNSTFSVSNSKFIENEAEYGGSIVMQSNSSLTISESFLETNTAEISGGALAVLESSNASLSSCSFENNVAKQGGAIGIYSNSSLSASNLTLTSNTP